MLISSAPRIFHLERAASPSREDAHQLAFDTRRTLPAGSQPLTTMMLPRAALITFTTTLTLYPTSAQILPPPHDSSTSLPDSPVLTKVSYHQGLASSNETAGMPGACDAQIVSTGEITTGYCVGLHTYALTIARVKNANCAFKLFKGSAACGVDATETTDVPIPSGEGDVCLVTGVEDGGKFTYGSGFLVCG